MLFFSVVANAAPGINQTISFQGRLLTSAGASVPDGFYNIQFKIYEGGTGTAAGNPGGTLKWTETYVNNGGQNGIKVSNGYMSVSLGSQTPFGNDVDWNNDTLWLSMNIAGLAAGCSTFNSGPCTADGEMVPMKRLTASPYAMNAGKVGGKSVNELIHNGTAQQTGNFNISGIGRANILRGTAGIEAPLLDRESAGTLGIGTQNATSIQIGSTTTNQTINIGTGSGNTSLALGSTNGTSSLALNGGSAGVTVDTAGGFTVRTDATDRDTLVIGSDGSAAINLSTATDFVINDTLNQNVLKVSSDGAIQTGANSNLAVNGTARFNQGIQVGDGTANGDPTLMTLDRAANAPANSTDALLGSMYYDTTLGKVQCYEADGWGACSSSPDSFVTLSPEFSNTVTNGTGIGSLTSDFCSDALNINDASTATPVCGTNETFNFYEWTTPQLSAQTKSLFVNYQLPSNFKKFVEGSVSLTGRTTAADGEIKYQLYRNSADGLEACGAILTVSSGAQPTWQKTVADNSNDPANCDFAAGDSIVFKIDMTAANDAKAYVSNLNFAFSNQ